LEENFITHNLIGCFKIVDCACRWQKSARLTQSHGSA